MMDAGMRIKPCNEEYGCVCDDDTLNIYKKLSIGEGMKLP